MDKDAQTDSPVHDFISRRWSPRAFDPQPIPPDQIRSLFEAVRWAASSFNEQPWSFLVARHEDGAKFEKLLGCLVPGNQSWAKNASLLLLTVAKRNFTHNDKPNRVAQHDIGLAIANLTFQAEQFGLRVHQMAGVDLERARKTYGIPVTHDPVTAVAIGYEGDVERLPEPLREAECAPRDRKSPNEFVFEGEWGNPAAI